MILMNKPNYPHNCEMFQTYQKPMDIEERQDITEDDMLRKDFDFMEHLIKTDRLTLHGLLFLLSTVNNVKDIEVFANLSKKRPLKLTVTEADTDEYLYTIPSKSIR